MLRSRRMTTNPRQPGTGQAPPSKGGGGGGLTLTERELFERLSWFTNIRWFMAAGTLGLLFASWYALGVRFHAPGREPSLMPGLYVTGLIFLYNAAFALLA